MAAAIDYCVVYAEISAEERSLLDTHMVDIVFDWIEISAASKQNVLDSLCTYDPEKQGEVGWPWPFNMISDWLASLWNHVTQAAIDAVSVISSWILNAQTAITDFVTESMEDVWIKISDAFKPVAGWVDTAVTWFTAAMIDFMKDPVGALSDSFAWVVTGVTDALSPIGTWVENTATWLTTGFTNFAADPLAAITIGVSYVWDNTKKAFDGALGVIGDWVANALAGVAEALGAGLQASFDWILKHLTWFSEMVVGAVNAVVAAIQGFVMDLGQQFMNTLTAVFTPGSPAPEVENTMAVMVETMNTRVVDEIKKMYKSPPTPEAVLATAGFLNSSASSPLNRIV